MKKIGLLSDTHGHLDKKIFEHFKSVDEIWHAGDFGSEELANQLSAFKPLRGVYGNIDGGKLRLMFQLDNRFVMEGFDVLITHIAGKPERYDQRIKKILEQNSPDILVCGHSHILQVKRDQKFNLWYLNPGAAGLEGFHKVKTILRFTIDNKKISAMEAIELGKRGAV